MSGPGALRLWDLGELGHCHWITKMVESSSLTPHPDRALGEGGAAVSETAGQVGRSGRRGYDLDCQFEQLRPRRRRHEQLEEVGPSQSLLHPLIITAR